MKGIGERYRVVQEKVGDAAARVGRSADEITVVAVTKTWPADIVAAAYECGLRHFGENRVEELASKRVEVSALLGDGKDIVWHQIGMVQSRKSKLLADNAHVFHALDRLKIAQRVARRLQETRSVLPTFLEVNVSGEASKSGFQATDWESDATNRDNLRTVFEAVAGLPGLQLQGLMTMAPWGVADEMVRDVFRRTRLLAQWLQQAVPHVALPYLSMGMSDDFEIAVEEGATHVRVGRAIFGSRHH